MVVLISVTFVFRGVGSCRFVSTRTRSQPGGLLVLSGEGGLPIPCLFCGIIRLWGPPVETLQENGGKRRKYFRCDHPENVRPTPGGVAWFLIPRVYWSSIPLWNNSRVVDSLQHIKTSPKNHWTLRKREVWLWFFTELDLQKWQLRSNFLILREHHNNPTFLGGDEWWIIPNFKENFLCNVNAVSRSETSSCGIQKRGWFQVRSIIRINVFAPCQPALISWCLVRENTSWKRKLFTRVFPKIVVSQNGWLK